MGKPRNILKSLRVKDFIKSSTIEVTDHLQVTKIKNLKTQFNSELIGTVAEFGFPFNVETATEQAAAFCKVYDFSAVAYLNCAVSGGGGGYTANYQLFPDTEAIGDFALFGAAAPFGVIKIDVSATAATYSNDAITWQYWNGTAWSTLTVLWDDTNTTPAAAGKRPFMQDGQIIFSAPTDWVASTIDSQEAYWVKAYVDAAEITQIPLLDSHEHYILTCPSATESPAKGVISRARFGFSTNSGANDHTDIILCNLSSGACSAIKILTKASHTGIEIANFNLIVDAGDSLAIYVTDEDGTTEYANGHAELLLTRSE